MLQFIGPFFIDLFVIEKNHTTYTSYHYLTCSIIQTGETKNKTMGEPITHVYKQTIE
jgi:hypothetical protein